MMTAFDLAWAIVKADGTVTSGTPGTNNPMHSRPPGYESGGILDPNRVRKPRMGSKKRSKKVEKPDAEQLLAENRRKLGDSIKIRPQTCFMHLDCSQSSFSGLNIVSFFKKHKNYCENSRSHGGCLRGCLGCDQKPPNEPKST
jgi:hypothetical protein